VAQAEPFAALGSAPAGIVYSCAGDASIAEALRSARSSLRHNRLPHLLFCSSDVDTEPGLSVVRFEPSDNPYLDKIANMRRSPFGRTIYLDTDTFVVDEIAHVLRLLDRYDLAVAYDPSSRGLLDPAVPSAFYEFNTGVIAWRGGDRMETFMRAWEETYESWLRKAPFPRAGLAERRADQPAFRRCAWQQDVQLFVLPPEYNFRLGEPGTAVERVRLLHGRRPDYELLAARINAKRGPRSWPRQLSLRARILGRARRFVGG
jgi:hypothetical protein